MRASSFVNRLVLLPAAASLALVASVAGRQPLASYHEKIPGTLVSFEMVTVPGAPALHVGRTEVTWDLYDVYTLRLNEGEAASRGGADAVARPSEPYGAPDRGWGHAGFPAMSVTREAAEAFCRWLAATTGKAYRLPTEAEWERVARLGAGGPTLSPARRDALAWHQGNAGGRSHPVGKRAPDALGLFDLFGNVGEWVMTADPARVIRGGSYREDAGPGVRGVQDPTWNQTDPQLPKSRWWLSDGPFAGFRVVLSGTNQE